MVKQKHVSQTPATQWLKARGIAFESFTYAYIDRGGSALAAQSLGVDEYMTIKTLIMEDEHKEPLVILMHGNKHVSTKNLARQINAKHITPCKPEIAQKHSGYMVGGTSPFGIRKVMPVYVEESILTLEYILINGGKRGFLLRLSPSILTDFLGALPVQCGQEE